MRFIISSNERSFERFHCNLYKFKSSYTNNESREVIIKIRKNDIFEFYEGGKRVVWVEILYDVILHSKRDHHDFYDYK